MITLFINDVDYSEYVTSISTNSKSSKNNIIGNVTSQELNVSLDNTSAVFNESVLSHKIILKKDNEYFGVFNILDKPEKMTNELSIMAYDNVILTGIEYNSELNYESGLITIKDILDEISSIIGVHIDYSDLDNSVLNRIVMNYDNTVTMREYLSMIGEIGGCNVNASLNGNITFKKINKNVVHNLYEDDVEKFETIETFNCTRVAFDNGVIIPISKGNEIGNTIYISNDNMLIDSQEQIDYLYSILNELSFISVKDFKIVEIENLQIGDIVNYNDEFSFIVLSIKTTFYNAEYNVQEISGEISTKQASIIESRNPTYVKIRRLKTLIDQNNASLKIVSEHQEDSDKKLTQFELGLDGVETTVKETQTVVENNEERLVDSETIIQQLSESIAKLVTDKNGASLMTQTSTGWTFNIGALQGTVDETSSTLNELKKQYANMTSILDSLDQAINDHGDTLEYVQVGVYEDEPCIELGESDSDSKLLITNTRIIFKRGSNTGTYIDDSGFVTDNTTINGELRQGHWVWKERANGNYGLSWIEVSD